MIKGYAGTAIEMQDVEEGALDLDELVRRQSQDNVQAADFAQTLIGYVPLQETNPQNPKIKNHPTRHKQCR